MFIFNRIKGQKFLGGEYPLKKSNCYGEKGGEVTLDRIDSNRRKEQRMYHGGNIARATNRPKQNPTKKGKKWAANTTTGTWVLSKRGRPKRMSAETE